MSAREPGALASLPATRSLRLRRTSDFSVVLGATGLLHGTHMGLALLAAARLGPESFAVWNLLAALIGYASHAHLGVLTGMARDVPIALGGGDAAAARALEALGFRTAALAAGGLMLVWALAAAIPEARSGVAADLWVAAGAVAAAQVLFLYTTLRARSKQQFRSQAAQTAAAAIGMLAAWVAGGRDAGLAGLAVSFVAGYSAGAGVGFVLDPPPLGAARAPAGELRRLVSVGLPILSAGLLFSLISTVDRWIVARFLGAEALGAYTVAIFAFGVAVLGPTVASQLSYPAIAFAWGRDPEPATIAPLVRRHSARGLAAGVVPALLLALVLPGLVDTWLPRYAAGVAPALVILPGVVAVGAAMGCANFLNTAGHHRTYLAVQALGLSINAAASSAAAWSGWGLVGVAAATSLSLCLYALLLAHVTRRRLVAGRAV